MTRYEKDPCMAVAWPTAQSRHWIGVRFDAIIETHKN